jgi:hypothetical protein
MWSQPTRSRSPAGRSYANSLPPREWELLIRLPARMLAAALTVRDAAPPVAEGLAGVAAIAAGRASRTALVREVVAAVFARDEQSVSVPGGCLSPPPPAAVCAECVAAGRVLAQRVPTDEAAAYRRWVLHVAEVACGGGWHVFFDDPIGTAQLRLLDNYERALAG